MMPPPPKTPASRVARATIFAAAAVLLLLITSVPGAMAANSGTIKVQTPDSVGDNSNDPKAVCSFYVEGFNMDATSGTLTIHQQGATGSAEVMNTTWTTNDVEDDDFADHHFLNGPYSLPDGHYKVSASDTQNDKTKVFKVECEPECEEDCEPTCEEDCPTSSSSTSTTSESSSTTPPTEIPFFPTGPALGLGISGAAVAGLLMLRRRL